MAVLTNGPLFVALTGIIPVSVGYCWLLLPGIVVVGVGVVRGRDAGVSPDSEAVELVVRKEVVLTVTVEVRVLVDVTVPVT